jgi:hypothetical protein
MSCCDDDGCEKTKDLKDVSDDEFQDESEEDVEEDHEDVVKFKT